MIILFLFKKLMFILRRLQKYQFFSVFSQAFFFSLDASNITDRIARFINDSRFPNCVVKVIEFDGEPNLCIFAANDIEKDTELRYNYNAPGLSWRNKVSSYIISFFSIYALPLLIKYQYWTYQIEPFTHLTIIVSYYLSVTCDCCQKQ